jgi:hypothetical protein
VYAICAPKIGIAKLANGVCPIFFPTAPKVTAGKAAKNSRTAGLSTLPLQGIVYFFDLVDFHGAKIAKRKIFTTAFSSLTQYSLFVTVWFHFLTTLDTQNGRTATHFNTITVPAFVVLGHISFTFY